jgi:hypothetical protein
MTSSHQLLLTASSNSAATHAVRTWRQLCRVLLDISHFLPFACMLLSDEVLAVADC